MKFKFTLQALESLREKAQEEALQAYARTVQQRVHVDERLQETQKKLERIPTETSMDNITIHIQTLNHIKMLRSRIDNLKTHIKTLKQEETKRLNHFLSCKKDVEILKKLKEKQRFLVEKTLLKIEENALGDWAQSMYKNQNLC